MAIRHSIPGCLSLCEKVLPEKLLHPTLIEISKAFYISIVNITIYLHVVSEVYFETKRGWSFLCFFNLNFWNLYFVIYITWLLIYISGKSCFAYVINVASVRGVEPGALRF